jgi:DUF4097 and DUF4098 domain-containing protein YvlB
VTRRKVDWIQVQEEEMSMKRLVVLVILSVALVCSVLALGCGSTVESRTDSFSVGSSPAVLVEVGNGSVTVVVGEENEIVVGAQLMKPEEIEYEASQDGDTVVVDVKTRRNSKADVTITVPSNTEFELSCGNGRIDVTGISASGTANVGNGDTILSDVMGKVAVNNGNGDIKISDATGILAVNLGNGDIKISDATGSFTLNLGNGAIGFKGELDPGTESVANVGNGSMTVELSGSPSVALDLEIQDRGTISVAQPTSVTEQSDYLFVGTIGDGEASLEASIGSGDIVIK